MRRFSGTAGFWEETSARGAPASEGLRKTAKRGSLRLV